MKDTKLVLEVDMSDVDDFDIISQQACKKIVFEKFAKANPKRVIEIYERLSESCDFGEVKPALFIAAINSEPLIEKLHIQFKNAGFNCRLSYEAVNESWSVDAVIMDGEVKDAI